LEAVAPWEGLYYPPTDADEFLSMETALIGMIEDIPQRVATLTRELESLALDDAGREMLDNMDFYFQGIRVSVASELDKLKAQLEGFKNAGAERSLSFEDRAFTCEISADLKGKYTSSIMGAAASLIAEGLWTGIEIEPILFPEKAEEFDRNEKLVEALSEVTESISTFLDQVPAVELIASWTDERRVDQYALSPFYTLLGNLGNLMQVSSRRALYSGDYHQIRQREGQLNTRIIELNMLHNMTWGTVPEAAQSDRTAVYGAMIAKATELVAILDVDILKKLVGEGVVKDLQFIVTMEKEDESAGRSGDEARRQARRDKLSETLQPLIPLLYDEDLKTFLELLLGSVLKRASLAVKRTAPSAPTPAPTVPAQPAAAATPSDLAASRLAGATEVLPPIDLPTAGPGADPGLASLDPPALLESTADTALQQAGTLDAPPLEDLDWQLPALEAPALEDLSFNEPPGGKPPAETPLEDPSMEETALSVRQLGNDLEASRLEALEALLEVLLPLLSRTSSQRKSFELVRRLLKQQRTIPAGLLQSMRPYLFEIMNQLVPKLREDVRLADLHTDYGENLIEHCQLLSDPFLSTNVPGVDLPASMEKVLDLLNHLAIATRSSIERLSDQRDKGTGVVPRPNF
ncbi:MAG: hypothetical protein AAF657_05350, partial [Acidobacteriota bacterium]